jgi:hypothetical protein
MTPSIEAQRLVSGFRAYMMMVAACRLNIPDLLSAGPKTADEVAASTLRTGRPAYEHLYRKSHFERLAEEPEMSANFNAAMVEYRLASRESSSHPLTSQV